MNRSIGDVKRMLFAGVCAVSLLIGAGPGRSLAQDADPFATPPDAGSGSASGGGSAPAADPGLGSGSAGGGSGSASGGGGGGLGAEAPANPAETPNLSDANPAPGNGSGSGLGSVAGAASGINPALDEAEQIDLIQQQAKYKLENEGKDPFRPLIEKKVAMPVVPVAPKTSSKPVGPPPPPPVKPIQLFVQGVCGNDGERLAMIVFENKPLTVTKDQVVDGKFKVVDILPDKLVIYSNKEQMRRTFPIGGGKE